MTVRLSDAQARLWAKFNEHTTEMVLTKSGRKMFPKLEYVIEDLDPAGQYALALEMHSVDDNRYKFVGGKWLPSGKGEPPIRRKPIYHPDGVMEGQFWMNSPVNFDRIKITNCIKDQTPSHIFLHSMHKYIPELVLYSLTCAAFPLVPHQASDKVQEIARIRLPVTEFIAVTAYQNNAITQLKITHNPFAKGFREACDRKRSSPSEKNEQSCEEVPHLSPPAKRLSPSSIVPLSLPISLPSSTDSATPLVFQPSPFPYPLPLFYPTVFNPYFVNSSFASPLFANLKTETSQSNFGLPS